MTARYMSHIRAVIYRRPVCEMLCNWVGCLELPRRAVRVEFQKVSSRRLASTSACRKAQRVRRSKEKGR
jgi:hypothetical protein